MYNVYKMIMDSKFNPLSNIHDVTIRHLIMQLLAWMWCIVFSFLVGSFWAFGISTIAHVLLLGAIAVTVGTFETAKRRPHAFDTLSGFRSHGRARTYTIWRDDKGNARKIPLDPNDPGGEHE